MGKKTKSIKPMCKRDSELFSFFIVLAIAVSAIYLLSALAPATVADGLNLTESWNKTFGGTATDKGYSVQQTTDGGYIVAGETYSYGAGGVDIWLIKTDFKGKEQWSRTFGGVEADHLDRGSVRQTTDGGYIITGYTDSYAVSDEADVWLIKTDANGIELWDRTFSGAGLSWGHSVQQTTDGGYIIAGRIIPQEGARADAWLIKTDANGTEEWNRTFGTDACEYAASVQQTSDDGYVLTGRTTSYGTGEADAWLIKTDSDGNEEWNRTFGGARYDYGYSVQQTTDGGYVIAGSTNGRDDVWLIKTDSSGTEEWNRVFGGTAKDEGYFVNQTPDGGYAVAGYTSSYGTADSADVWLIKTDSDGNEEWNMTFGGADDDRSYSVQPTIDAGYIVAGYTASFGAGSNDMWLIKLSQPGAEEIDILPTALDMPPTLYANSSTIFNASVENAGTGLVNQFNVSLTVDGSSVDMVTVPSLEAGETTTVDFSWTPSGSGDFELCVLADCDGTVTESDETNNEFCKNVTVISSLGSSCWNDTFDDKSKIADSKGTIVKDGNVEIYFDSPGWIWNKTTISGCEAPAIAFNITGDGKWNMICGLVSGGMSGYYWNGTHWTRDDSVVAGISGIKKFYDVAPVVAFNMTGNGRWNLIAGGSSGGPNVRMLGAYYDGTQWIIDDSLVSGLAVSPYPKPAIAFNITGDGSWNLIIAEARDGSYGAFRGYYWNGTQWVNDFSLLSGLGSVEYGYGKVGKYPSVSTAFNLTGDRRWNLISGEVGGRYRGFYWYKSRWVSDSSFVSGLHAYNTVHNGISIIRNLTGDANWNAFTAGDCFEQINVPGWTTSPGITSDVISPPYGYYWSVFHANSSQPQGTTITYKIVDEWYNTLMYVVDGQDISELTDVPIRLSAELITDNETRTPVLHNWSACWGLPGDVLKDKMRLTFDFNSSTSPGIATDSQGNQHIVWCDDNFYEGCWLYYKKLAADGFVLVTAKSLCRGESPKIAGIDSRGNVHVAFRSDMYNVSYLKLDNNGNILVGPKQIASLRTVRGLAIDQNDIVHAIAGGGGCGDQKIVYVKLDNEGNELINYTIDNTSCCGYAGTAECLCAPSGIAVDSAGKAYTAYTKGLGNCRSGMSFKCNMFPCWWPACAKAYFVMLDDDGVHIQELTGELPLPSVYPAVCVDGGDNKHVIWSQHNRSVTVIPGKHTSSVMLYGFDFYYTKFDKSDNKIINAKRLTYEDYPLESSICGKSVSPSGIHRPIIDIESGVIHVTWAGESKIYYMAFDASGGTITNKTTMSAAFGDSRNPAIDAGFDGAHIVWSEKREYDTGSEIYYAKMVLPENMLLLACPGGTWTAQNDKVTYAIGLMHTLPVGETIDISLENLDGADVAELSHFELTLDPYTPGEVILNVTDADVGDYRVKIRAESHTNPAINAECVITTLVEVPTPDLIVTAIDAYHYTTNCLPWFNLANEVDVTVKNIGTANASSSYLCLYADAELMDRQEVPGLARDNSTTVQFRWTPTGEDCFGDCNFNATYKEYTLKAVVDCDSDLNESTEDNNELITQETACYNGYMADDPLQNAVHGMFRGGIIFTTGYGSYGCVYKPNATRDANYEITLPPGATVKLAQLNVYYTWTKPKYMCPDMEVSITTQTGTYVLPLERSYNDLKCQGPGAVWPLTWGNYIYDLTDYITGSGNYTVTVKNAGSGVHSFCMAAPGIVLLYEDETAPVIEYWLNEGADLLIGGRRADGGSLALEECITPAVFPGSIATGNVVNATLGVVAPWAGSGWEPGTGNYLYFNGVVLGQGVYHGFNEKYEATKGGITMIVDSTNRDAQVGVNVTDVTEYLNADGNVAGQGDDGDNMMPTNAFLVLEYSDLKVNKTVRDAVRDLWVKELRAKLNATLRFRCVIENAGRNDMTNISVVDILPHSFEYRGNATVDGTSREPDWIAGDQFGWNFSGPLTVGETITIEFDATVVNLGSGTNIMKASAWDDEQWFSAEDYARVIVPEPLSTPLFVYGWVNHSTGSPVNNPDVVITNLNTTKIFVAGTSENSNYYQVKVRNVNVGNVLHFRATDNGGNTIELNYSLTQEAINVGGLFSFNITLEPEPAIFDTGEGTYPSIAGTHRGTLTPNHTIEVNKVYTYACAGTGGHSEYVEIYNDSFYINATGYGNYTGDYHNISFPHQFSLLANHTYNYTIMTGSYPQIHHTNELEVAGGIIICTEFTDVNGDIHNNWIPAIKLFT